jgi:hypothetical protein
MPENRCNEAPSTHDIASRGEAIYQERYQIEFEKSQNDKFVAININTGGATVADTGEDAIRIALEGDPNGLFHLIRVGHKAAFNAGWFMSCVR